MAGQTRRVWDNPILWREIRTWAYGRKMLVIRLAYLLLFALAAASLHRTVSAGGPPAPPRRAALAPLLLLSLVLVNAQAVTSMTSERDCRALDLLLVTRPDAQGNRLRQARRRVLQHQGDGPAAHAAVRISLAVARALSLENLLYLWAGRPCSTCSWPCWGSTRA